MSSLVERTALDPSTTPVAALVQPQVSYKIGPPTAYGGFGIETVDRQEYYQSVHPQTIAFEIAREVVRRLAEVAGNGGDPNRSVSRNALFPQVLRIVQAYIRNRVDFNGVHPCEIGLQIYAQRIAGLLIEKLLDHRHPPARVWALVAYLMGSFESVAIVSSAAPVPPSDPDDEIFLICAIDGDADYLVSEDRDLLSLKSSYQRPEIGRCSEIINAFER